MILKLVAIIAAIGVVGEGAVVYTQHKQAINVEEASSVTREGTMKNDEGTKESEAFSIKGSINDLLGKNGNYKCTARHTTAAGASQGIVYISGTTVRGDFTTDVAGLNTKVESHFVTEGEYMYTWSNMMPQGVKIKVDASAMAGNTKASAQGQQFDANQELDYDCEAWTVDSAVFVKPSTVTFIDIATQGSLMPR